MSVPLSDTRLDLHRRLSALSRKPYGDMETALGELLAEVDRLRAESERRRQAAAANAASAAALQKQIDEQAQELDQLRTRLAEIAELHAPMGGDCGYCADETGGAHTWPCPTSRLAAPSA